MKGNNIGSSRLVLLTATLLLCAFLLGACYPAAEQLIVINDEDVPLAAATVLTPTTGSVTHGNATATIDASNVSNGYVMCKYSGSVSKVKVQINKSGGTTYTYNLNTNGNYEVFPLTAGNGSYTINIYENVSGNQYSLAYGTTVSVSLSNANSPFLYPSQYVNFNSGSTTVQKAAELTGGSTDDIERIKTIYNYVVTNISYDTAKASSVQSGYVPSVDSVLASGKGICFDYAAVMAAMLRSQGIPTQLRVGYVSGGVYHAWIGVYTPQTGWINDAIYFDGTNWKLMDPTFASSGGQGSDIMQFIGNGSNYSTVYTY